MTFGGSSPIIGVTTDFENMERPSGKKETAFLYRRYYQLVEQGGGIPILLPPLESTKSHKELVSILDGILLTGGDDIHPHRYHQDLKVSHFTPLHPLRETWEFHIIDLAVTHKIPLLGICLGSQIINVYFGGTLIQDIPTQKPSQVLHKQKQGHGVSFHKIAIKKHSLLYKIFQQEVLEVNSFHHQGIAQIGRGLICSAFAEDGIPEAIEGTEHPFLLGVQWHPEMNLLQQPHSIPLIKAFIEASFSRKRMVS